MSSNRKPDCPSDQTLQQIAAGEASNEIVIQNTAHLTGCDFCAPRFRRYVRDFSDEISPEESAFLKQLKSSTPEWRERKVKEIVPDPPKRAWFPGLGFKWPALAAAGLAAVVAIAEGPAMIAAFHASQTNKLVNNAYVERRTTEMRFPSVSYAKYQPLSQQLAAGGSQASAVERPNLAIALGEIGKKLQSQNSNPKYLENKGRLQVLEGTKESVKAAKQAFEEAQDHGLNTPALQTDLAVSYFQSELLAHPDDPKLMKSIELLTAVVNDPKLKPNDEQRLAAMFDLALAYEHSNSPVQARDTWNQYLQLDSSSGWASEAREHLAKLPAPSPQSDLRLDPAWFLQHENDAETRQNIEEFLEAAVTSWLPDALAHPDSTAARALRSLAAVLADEHSDMWLRDLLAATKPGDADALKALSASIIANRKDEVKDALLQAEAAEVIFTSRRNVPGKLFAQYQQAYAQQRLLDGSACLSRAGPLLSTLKDYRYPWLQSQTALETAICTNFSGDSSKIEAELEDSVTIATKSAFPIARFRILGIAAGIHRSQEPKCDKSWRDGIQGLEQYWKGNYPEEVLFQFYSVLAQCAEQTENFHAAKAMLTAAIATQEDIGRRKPSIDNVALRSTLYLYLANIMEALHEEAEAETEIRKADALLGSQPDDIATIYKLTAKIRLADIQSKHRKPEVALSTLMLAHDLLAKINNRFLELDFYRVAGDIYSQESDRAKAAEAYQKSITISEDCLANLKDPSERLKWTIKTEPAYRGLVRSLLAQRRAEDAWKLWEWSRSRSMLAITSLDKTQAPIQWPALQQDIDRLHVAAGANTHIVFFTDDDAVNVWVVTPQSVKAHRIAVTRPELDRLLNRFADRYSVETSNIEEVHALGERLYSLLFAPLSEDIHDGSITVELDGPLQKLLVEALRTRSGTYLGEKYQIAYSPGMLVENYTLRQTAPITSADRMLQLEGDGYVPGRDEERNAILHLFPNSSAIEGPQAEINQIQSALARSDMMLYTGHGKEYGTGAALVLKDEPGELLLHAGNLPRSMPHLKLAVLAACGTGTSDENGLLDTSNLVHPLLAAGVPQVISSRWNLEAESTRQLVEAFYTNLSHRQTPALALQNAEKELLAKNNHPYFWAGLYLAGRIR